MASLLLLEQCMPRLSILPTLVREAFFAPSLCREPEPDLVMDGDAQVHAYSAAGRASGSMAAAYLFHAAHISEVIAGARRVVELGCGSATQLGCYAASNPGIEILGVDLSTAMLDDARRHVAELGLSNVRFAQGDMTRLDFIPDHSVDAVVSTMALHHLPTRGHLEQTFAEVARILSPGGALYLVDFALLRSARSLEFFARQNADAQPELFTRDYRNSMRAAFPVEDFRDLAAKYLPAGVQHHAMSPARLLQVVKTKSQPLARREAFAAKRDALDKRYRVDLDDLRLAFRLGGMKSDPFRP